MFKKRKNKEIIAEKTLNLKQFLKLNLNQFLNKRSKTKKKFFAEKLQILKQFLKLNLIQFLN